MRSSARRTFDSGSEISDSDSSTDDLAIAAALAIGSTSREKSVVTAVPPYFIVAPSAVLCNAGQKAQLRCQVGGSSPVGVKWYHNCTAIIDGDRHRLIDKGSEHWLEIFDTCPSDGGEIRCAASNDISSVDCIFSLSVNDCEVTGQKPEFNEILEHEHVSAKTGQKRLTLTFRTTGSPEPRVHFFHDEVLLTFDERVRLENCTPGQWRVVIDDPQPIDNGVYTAVSKNRFGEAKCDLRVNVNKNVA